MSLRQIFRSRFKPGTEGCVPGRNYLDHTGANWSNRRHCRYRSDGSPSGTADTSCGS